MRTAPDVRGPIYSAGYSTLLGSIPVNSGQLLALKAGLANSLADSPFPTRLLIGGS